MEELMATVRADSANWRLFGGGGLALGGLLWLIATVVPGAPGWLGGVALIVIAAALVFVAFGQTGSNGAVGASLPGKISLVVFALGWLLLGINAFVPLGATVALIAAILVIVGGFASAWFIFSRRVAKGAAGWVLFVTAVFGLIYFAPKLGVTFISGGWIVIVLAVLYLVTGVLYLFNNRRVG
jgi:hypothetical protein